MQLKEFLNSSYTAYHTTANLANILQENGFTQLLLTNNWQLKNNGKYFVTINGSSIVAFGIGANKVFNIVESHSDSPSFKVKGNSIETAVGKLSRLNTEMYGGAIAYSYLDRPLKIAGRIVEQTENGIQQKLVVSDYNVVIPSLAIHLNNDVNDGMKFDMQNDTLALIGQDVNDVYKTFTNNDVLDADLFVVPSGQAFDAGINNEFVCSARIDNLTSAYTSTMALINSTPQDIAIVACLDNEEIGSTTRQGTPNVIDVVLNKISCALGMDYQQNVSARQNGFVLSVDNCHATHSAHPEKSDPQHVVVINNGIAIKHFVNYATDGLSGAVVKRICQLANVKYQDLYNRSNGKGGSTLGLVTARQLGMRSCDIGLPQLAMHSACETVGASDIEQMQKCLTAFLSCKIDGENDITITL